MADTICAFLEARGVQCWVAPRDILPGEEWGDSILRGIQACRIMVLIFSKSANDSGPVRSEVDRAVNARKVLIPFRIENVAPTGAMEFHIGRRHWLDAYTPPLERHLELLARAVRDVLKPPTEGAAEHIVPPTNSISGTLPAASTIVRHSGVVVPSVVAEGEGPLRILFNFNHVVIVGYPSTFQVMVENRGSVPLERIEIAVESRGLEQAATKTLAKLAPAQWQRHLFEIEPIRSGNFVLQVTIKCREESKQLAFVGSRSLRVNEAPGTSDIVSSIKDLLGNSDKPGTTSGGESTLGHLVAPGNIRTLNDLLNLELPENFEPLELALDYEVSMRALAQEQAAANAHLQIPGAFLTQAQAGTILKLEPVESSTTSAYQEIRLIARPSFSLGRSREEADFLLWFWPRNETNDAKTRRISKKHCVLNVKEAKIFVSGFNTANRSTFDGQDLAALEGVPLERRGILSLAGIYFLDVTPFSSNDSQGPKIGNLRNWMWPGTTTAPAVSGSVRFIPMTPRVFPQNSTWMFTDGTFGTSRTNPIILDLKGLAEIQGRFYHYLGAFWIESSVNNDGVQINGNKLSPGFIMPLVSGQIMKLGERSFRVTVAA